MRIEPEQVRAMVKKLREWGYEIHNLAESDLIDEFDIRDDIDEDKIGKFTRESETSRLAALAVTPRTGTQRRKIYDLIKSESGGLTRDQIANWLRIPENSVRPRVKELIEGGWVIASGTRTNQNGNTVEILHANATKE